MNLDNFELFKRKPAAGQAAPAPAPAPIPAQTSAPEVSSVATGPVAAVTVDGSGKIMSVDDGCSTMFGWKAAELVGQHLKVLVKDWPDNQLAKFLQPPKKGESNQLLSMRVTGRRMDGREFPVSMTRLAWTSDKASGATSASAHGCWTAVFREVVEGGGRAAIAPYEDAHASGPAVRMDDVSQFKGSMAALRSANEELQKKLEAISMDAWRKGELVNKSEKERAELTQRLETHDAEMAAARAELDAEIGRRSSMESQLNHLLATKADLEKQLAEQDTSKQDLQRLTADIREQLSDARAAVERAMDAHKKEVARADALNVSLTNLQHGYDELSARLTREKQTAVDSKRRIEELESMLRGTMAEVERANAEMEKVVSGRNQLEAEWREKVRAATVAAERAEAACKQESVRADRCERDLASLRAVYEEVNAKFRVEQQSSADTTRRMRELETTLRETSAEAERANVLLQKVRAERARLEAEWQEQLNAARAAAERAETAYKQEVARANRFERELANQGSGYDTLDTRLAAERQSTAEARRRADELESRLRQKTAELERAKSALSSEQTRRDLDTRSVPPDPSRHEPVVTLGRVLAEVEREREERRRVEQQYASLTGQMQELYAELRRLSAERSGSPRSSWDRDRAA